MPYSRTLQFSFFSCQPRKGSSKSQREKPASQDNKFLKNIQARGNTLVMIMRGYVNLVVWWTQESRLDNVLFVAWTKWERAISSLSLPRRPWKAKAGNWIIGNFKITCKLLHSILQMWKYFGHMISTCEIFSKHYKKMESERPNLRHEFM